MNERMNELVSNGSVIIGTHTNPDLDALAAIRFLLEAYPELKKKYKVVFLKGGDEKLDGLSNMILVDRGQGELDHHQLRSQETAASMVAKKFGLDKDPINQKFLEIVKANDLRGETKILSIGDIIKRLAHNKDLPDEEKLKIGLRLIDDAMEFQRKHLIRDHQFAKELYQDLKRYNFLGYEVRRYFERQNEKFQRPFDLVEILTAEKTVRGKEEAIKFAKELIRLISKSESDFQKALQELERAWIIFLDKKDFFIAGESNNPAFNKAARSKGAILAIQKSEEGCQIYFDFKKVSPEEADMIMAIIRLLEQVYQKKKILITDFFFLSERGKLKEIPEWYYFVSNDKNGGRFILNKSLTATDSEEIPETKIPLEKIVEVVKLVLILGENFSFKVFVHKTLLGYSSLKNQ